jgi:2,4-dienoyl-CoA reductase-like NADH-dependent reductase (Old Yellow Enzyme family)
LSVFDSVPYQTSREVGQPWAYSVPYEFGFGVDDRDPLKIDLAEPIALIEKLHAQGVVAVNISAGSPYYNPHLQRPAIFPPSDGYLPPEDPLVGVWRHIDAARQCKQALPHVLMVGTGYSYLQDYLPHVAQAVIRLGWIDAVGVGRMVLAYPELPADCLTSGRLARKKVCRTFSDCTTGPRMGLVSGCYPLDEYYKKLPEGETLRRLKQKLESGE